MRLTLLISRILSFWFPFAVVLVLIVFAIRNSNVGMAIFAVVVAMFLGLYKFIMAGAAKDKGANPPT